MFHHMNEAFNLTAEYERDIKPHIDAIWNKCKELNIPCLLTVCHANNPLEDGSGTQVNARLAVHFCGPTRTPPSYLVASLAINESPLEAALAVLSGAIVDAKQETISTTDASASIEA